MLKNLDVVAAIIEREGKILLARRPEDGDQPGLWEFPGGKVEADETQLRRWRVNCWKSWALRQTLAIMLPATGARFQAG